MYESGCPLFCSLIGNTVLLRSAKVYRFPIRESPPGGMRSSRRGNILPGNPLARGKPSRSLKNEGFRELKWTCPLCSLIGNTVLLRSAKVYRFPIRESPPGGMRSSRRGNILPGNPLARGKAPRSLKNEGFRELKRTCPLFYSTGNKKAMAAEHHDFTAVTFR